MEYLAITDQRRFFVYIVNLPILDDIYLGPEFYTIIRNIAFSKIVTERSHEKLVGARQNIVLKGIS